MNALIYGCAVASLALLAAPSTLGQIGDKPGEAQRSQVPEDQIPPAPSLSPEEALDSFQLAPGVDLELAASEPLVQDPVDIAFGPDGAMWVVEMRGYMPDLDGTGEDAPVGRIVVLRDEDRDGFFETRTVFLEDLVMPRAVLPVGGGALVGAPPELAHWRDTDGDGRADEKTLVASDYGVAVDPARPHLANPERAPNSLLWAADNWIYSTAYVKKFRYRKGAWETASTPFRGQWGLSQDDFGRLFYNSNSDQLRADIIHPAYLERNPSHPQAEGTNVDLAVNQLVWPARVTPGVNRGYRADVLRDGKLKAFTAACAPWIYRGDLLPEFYGDAFVAEPAGNLVRRNIVTPRNGTLSARNAYDRSEFIASTDERFRPVNFETGPDGALYIVDLYRGVLQHRISLTTYLREQSEKRGLAAPIHYGRIWRVVPTADGLGAESRSHAFGSDPRDWIEHLSHPNSWWRETAQQLLVERGDLDLAPNVRAIATSGPNAQARATALRTLDGMQALDRATVLATLHDVDPVALTTAIRLAERFLDGSGQSETARRLLDHARSDKPEVQLQAVLSLGEAADPDVDLSLAKIVARAERNVFLRDAFYSGLAGRELALLRRLVYQAEWRSHDEGRLQLLSDLSRGVFKSRITSNMQSLFTLTTEIEGPPRVALLNGMAAAADEARRPLLLPEQPPQWDQLASYPGFQAQMTRIDAGLSWPGKEGRVEAVAPLSSKEQERFNTGRQLFANTCAACHQPNGQGLDGLAPPLLDSEWVLGPPERLLRIVLHGVRGRIKVNGKFYTGDMPAFGFLDDEQIAAIATYIRRDWSHGSSPISPKDVERVRAATRHRTDAWGSGELMRVK